MVSLVQQLPHTYQAVKVEAMVASKAMEFGKEIGVAKVIVGEDSATVAKALCSSDKGLAFLRVVSRGYYSLLWFLFKIVLLLC